MQSHSEIYLPQQTKRERERPYETEVRTDFDGHKGRESLTAVVACRAREQGRGLNLLQQTNLVGCSPGPYFFTPVQILRERNLDIKQDLQ